MLKNPTLKEEKKLWKKGFRFVVGLDEAGRGPLAGPVIAAAVLIKTAAAKFSIFLDAKRTPRRVAFQFSKIRDSKKLSPKKREEFYKILTNPPAGGPQIEWGIGMVSEKVIDKINILEATKLAMLKAVGNLNFKLKNVNLKKRRSDGRRSGVIGYLILDGNFKINSKIPQKSIIKADEKVFSCAAASIIAKVTRDRIMTRLHKKYPKYRFDLHKGYGTKLHYQKIAKFGICKIHRKSFRLE